MKGIFKKIVAVSFALIFGCAVFAGCDGKEDQGDKPLPPTPEPTDGYGENWADAYDAAYTESLLAMGEEDFTKSQIAGTSGVGAQVKTHGSKKQSKYVGIFYFMWLGEGWSNIYDISKIQEEYADLAYNTQESPLWANADSKYYKSAVSPQNAFHYFEEPLYGYYHSKDKWVIKRHLELLSMAGVDFLYLDFTNAHADAEGNGGNLYPEATYALLDSILEMQQLGYDVPQIVPIACNNVTPGGTKTITRVVEWLYNNYYAKDNFKYKSCWFTADATRNPSGDPLLVCYDFDPQYLSNSAVANAFWIRNVVWPTAVSSLENGFPWMDYSLPQDNYDGIMNVSVAQHIGGSWSSEAFLARSKKNTALKYRGRSANVNQKYAYETDNLELANYGQNFENQWYNAIHYQGDDEVWMVTVTGWNEWVAQKLNINGQYATFVDTFNVAFSRDTEMMRDSGGYADNYFMLLAANVRDFKYDTTEKTSAAAMWKRQTVNYQSLQDWEKVQAKYIDFTSDAMVRNEKSVANVYTYTDDSARNDISYVKIANDSDYLYVLVAADKAITAHESGDKGWMNLYLSTGEAGGWENYNYLINRDPLNGKTSVEKLGTDENGKITVKSAGEAEYYVQGNYISYRIALKDINVTSASELQLKACDNVFAAAATQENDGVGVYSFGNIMAFYCGGDCAPIGRLNYAYRMAY